MNKKRTFTIELTLIIPEKINKIAINRDGQILCFTNQPSVHVLGDWSNQWLCSNVKPEVVNYKKTIRSVK